MGADIADRLRALARDHLEGRSSLETYRRLRAQLLDSLLAPPAADATQPRAAVQPVELTQPRAPREDATQPREARPPIAGRREPAPGPSGTATGAGRIAAYAGLGLLACAVALLVWRHHSRSLASPGAVAAADRSDGTNAGEQTEPIQALLEPLLERPDWSDARVLALNEALLEAGRTRINAVRDTDWFNAFVDSVRSRLRQQQALAGAPLTPDSSPLAALAVTLGIDLAIPAQPSQAGPGGAERASRSAQAPARPEVGPASRIPGKSAERTKGAQQPAAGTGEPAEPSQTAPAPAEGVGSASVVPVSAGAASAASHATILAGSPGAVAQPADPQAAGQVSAGTSAASRETAARALAPRQYPACSAALSQERRNFCQDFLASGAPGPLLAVIPRGSFMMGNSEVAEEGPVHRVTLSYDFAMSVYEVSQSEFQMYCREAGQACPQQPWARGDDPVVNVSWHDAQDYARWLSRATHQKYRLPTEAEWEYAARAGQTGLYPSGNSLSPTDAYFSMGTTLAAPAPRSMRFNANAWHLMLMVSNVREWVEDAWSPGFSGAPVDGSAREQGQPGARVVRGGCYADPAIRLRLSARSPLPADTRDHCTGIRLVREIR